MDFTDKEIENMSLWKLAKVYGINYATLYGRVKYSGIPLKEAVKYKVTLGKGNNPRKYTVELTIEELAYLSKKHKTTVGSALKHGWTPHDVLFLKKWSHSLTSKNKLGDELASLGIAY